MYGRVAVELDHASLVNHLVGDRHRVGALEDADTVAVDRGAHAAVDAEPDAAIVVREVVERVELGRAERASTRRSRLARAAGIVERRRAAVRRIDDERREAERARAPLVTEERLGSRGARATGLLRGGALDELLLRQATPACRELPAARAEYRACRRCSKCLAGSGGPKTSAVPSSSGPCTPLLAARRGFGALR